MELDPKTYEEAIEFINANFWKEVMNSELECLIANGTWTLADLPRCFKKLKSKWVLLKKLRAGGTIDNFKARLVIQGFNKNTLFFVFHFFLHQVREC